MRIKNATTNLGTWHSQEIAAGAYYELNESEIRAWAIDGAVLGAVLAGELIVANPDDVTDPVTGLATLRGEIPRPVETRREVRDLRLQGVALSGEADINGVCEVAINVPATGVDSGRYLDWGEGWITGESHADDRITAIDVEGPFGEGGAWVKVSGYCDDDASEAGWNIPMKPEIAEVEPLGWYGFLPGGLRLRITAQCGGSVFTGRKLKINLGWGKRDT